jgi:hypothetical protein
MHGFQHICNECFKAQRAKRKQDRMERRAVTKFVKTASVARGGSNIPHTSEMLESIMALFGGVNGMANTMAMQYYAASPGSRIRNQILEMIMKLVARTAETGGTAKPTTLMSDAEIEAAISQRLENAVSAHRNLSYLQEHGAPQPVESIGVQLSPEDIAAAEAMSSLAALSEIRGR